MNSALWNWRLSAAGRSPPLITDPQSEIGKMLNDMHEAYINYLNMYVFPYIYYCF